MYFLLIAILSSTLLALPEGINELDQECNEGIGLSCAKAAYLTKRVDTSLALKYYQRGCELNDESACYNLKSLNPNKVFYNKVEGVMKFHATNISNCYIPNLKNKRSQIQLKEAWHKVSMKIHINHEGQGTASNITSHLPSSFSPCAKKIIAQIPFPTSEKNISHVYDYTLLIMSHE